MQKSLVVIAIICVALTFSACEAFKSNYNPSPKMDDVAADLAAAQSEAPAPAEGGTVEGEAPKIDYSTDASPCENIAEIAVSVIESGEAVNAGFGEESEVVANKLGDFTTKITVKTETEQLSFTIKKVADDAYNVCDVAVTGCVGECVGTASVWSKVTAGKIELLKFNEKVSDTEIINAGTYEFSFDASSTGDEARDVGGAYSVNVLE